MTIAGKPANEWSRRDLAKIVGYVPQAHQIVFPFSVLQLVLLGRTPHIPAYSRPGKKDVDIAIAALKRVGIEHLMDAPVNRISGGECQLAVIARALARNLLFSYWMNQQIIWILETKSVLFTFLTNSQKVAPSPSSCLPIIRIIPSCSHAGLVSCKMGCLTGGPGRRCGHKAGP